ncbi:hypothetical protein M422DRAFT_253151 [Sphaerobolus stellatus SS14]|uniref:Uncharacterized protein n=1 Tax=Sphaerobolus stellatus (strain SS14) TaxID=990650 RepID=A0A0C9V9B1_SPHS4|nr:hypothetical protein M422DRAFT_253151 [Sphaerobolus stellatus SS14]
MQVDPSTTPISAIQASKDNPTNLWVIESTPGFITIKHKMGFPICNVEAATTAWPELARFQGNYYCLLETHEEVQEELHSVKKKAEEHRAKNLEDQVHSLEQQLQELKESPEPSIIHEDIVLKNKHLKEELDYYIGRACCALQGIDLHWAIMHEYYLNDIC